MGKLVSFDILLANSPPVFFSGQSVSGTVVVDLNDAMQMRAIRARIYGRAYCFLEVFTRESVSDGRGGSIPQYSNENVVEHETFLDHQITLWGKRKKIY